LTAGRYCAKIPPNAQGSADDHLEPRDRFRGPSRTKDRRVLDANVIEDDALHAMMTDDREGILEAWERAVRAEIEHRCPEVDRTEPRGTQETVAGP